MMIFENTSDSSLSLAGTSMGRTNDTHIDYEVKLNNEHFISIHHAVF